MFHMITDNLDAYRMAVAATATAQSIVRLNPLGKNIDELVNCQADEQLKLDSIKSIIGLAIREAAAKEPHNPFSQPDPSTVPTENKHGSFPPPPRKIP